MPKTGLSAVLFDREDPKNKWELEEDRKKSVIGLEKDPDKRLFYIINIMLYSTNVFYI